jgi:nitrite reductase/ring-hydroxylating ferredoxin subunit
MPLIDDLKLPMTEHDEHRREFLAVLGAGAMALAGLGTTVTAVRFLWPEVLFEQETRFAVGRPEEIAQGTLLVLPEQKVFVVHDAAGFFALSATCTHLGCMTRYEKENNRIFCPCHGSQFAVDGAVTGGPAPRPLHRLNLALEDGRLVVDVAKPVVPGTVLKV